MTIVGYMGSGKSAIGRILAEKLGWQFVDLDREIERREGRSIPEIFEESGEGRFRDLEHKALLSSLGGTKERVVACGGGAVVHPGNRKRLEQVATVFLEEDLKVLYRRTRNPNRPLRAASYDEFERRYAERLPHYLEMADFRVAVRERPKQHIAEEIVRWLNA